MVKKSNFKLPVRVDHALPLQCTSLTTKSCHTRLCLIVIRSTALDIICAFVLVGTAELGHMCLKIKRIKCSASDAMNSRECVGIMWPVIAQGWLLWSGSGWKSGNDSGERRVLTHGWGRLACVWL